MVSAMAPCEESKLEQVLRSTAPSTAPDETHLHGSALARSVLENGGQSALLALSLVSRSCRDATKLTRLSRVHVPSRGSIDPPPQVASVAHHVRFKLSLYRRPFFATLRLFHNLHSLTLHPAPFDFLEPALISKALTHCGNASPNEIVLEGELAHEGKQQTLLQAALLSAPPRSRICLDRLNAFHAPSFKSSFDHMMSDFAPDSLYLQSVRLHVPDGYSLGCALPKRHALTTLEHLCLESSTIGGDGIDTMKSLSVLSLIDTFLKESAVQRLVETVAPRLTRMHIGLGVSSTRSLLNAATHWPQLRDLIFESNFEPIGNAPARMPALESATLKAEDTTGEQLEDVKQALMSLLECPHLRTLTLIGVDMSLLSEHVVQTTTVELRSLSLKNVRRQHMSEKIAHQFALSQSLRRLDLSFRVWTGNATTEILQAAEEWTSLRELRVYGQKAERGSLPVLEWAMDGVRFPRLERVLIGPASDLVRDVGVRLQRQLPSSATLTVTDRPFD